MALVAQLALVSDTPRVSASDLTIVAAALQKQISRDLSPTWELDGTISAFMRLEDVPSGYWSIIVRDDIEIDTAGAHCDHDGQPLAQVTFDREWPVTASHEAV